MADPLDTKKIK